MSTSTLLNKAPKLSVAHGEMRQRVLGGIASMPDLLAIYTQEQRLLELDTPLGKDVLLLERFEGVEALGTLYEFKASCFSDNLFIDLKSLIGKQVDVSLKQADGSRQHYSGFVSDFAQAGSDGGFARYDLTFRPWLWLLTLRRDSWVFQEKSVVEIVQEVFADYPQANYRLDLKEAYPKRSYCVQYRESDYAFVTRLLAEEGISFAFEFTGPSDSSDESPSPTHARLVLADHNEAWQEDPSSAAGSGLARGVRFHRQDATETTDAIKAFGGERALQTNAVRLATWDYKPARTSHIHESTNRDNGDVPGLTAYDAPGAYYYTDGEDGSRYARLRMEALEARNKTFHGEGNVRSFQPGNWFELVDHPIHDQDSSEDRQFVLLSVTHEARNNLPEPFRRSQPGLFGNEPAKQAPFTYRNRFTCLRRTVVYRPAFDQTTQPKSTVLGPQTALVVGPAGEEIYTDDQHRIKIQFHWQRADNRPGNEQASCWVRVASPMAGSDYGGNQIPRIGQEVVVSFLESDIDRPVVTGRVYNGAEQPAWYAPGILSGYKSKEYQGVGYNQFVMDDATGQLRTAFHTTEHATQLNLGWLIHQHDNNRGAERGHGFELRSDAWGALRASLGLYLSTHARVGAASQQQDAGEATTQLQNGLELAKILSDAASQHNADSLAANDKVQSLKDISAHQIPQGEQQVPQFQEPILVAGSAADIALATDQSTHLAAGHNLHLSSGEDMNLAIGGNTAIAVDNAASLFAHRGPVKLYAGKGPISLQAQDDEMHLIADRSVTVTSVDDEITVAAKGHLLLTAGGAYIKLEGGNIQIHAPGKISIKGATHDFAGPASMEYLMPSLPRGDWDNWLDLDLDGFDAKAMAGVKYTLHFPDGTVRNGVLDGNGYAREVSIPNGTAEVIYHNDPSTKDPIPLGHSAALGFEGENIQALEASQPTFQK
jgi:type VI secretion system secreted protein VgrG